MKWKKGTQKEKIKALVKNGGLAESSLKKRKSVMKGLNSFLGDNGYPSSEEFIIKFQNDPDDVEQFQEILQEFFYGMEKENGERPKYNTFCSYLTNIKNHVLKETNKRVDIMDPVKFATFTVSEIHSFLQKLATVKLTLLFLHLFTIIM